MRGPAPARRGTVDGAKITKKPAPGQEKANLEVNVELERPEMPIGVDKLLDILELSVASKKEEPDE